MLRQFLSGTKTNLLNQPIVNGQVLFPNDASEIYYDINGTRKTVQSIAYVNFDSDLTGIVNPEERLYFSIDSRRLFVYNSSSQEFIQINRTGVVNNLTSAQRIALESCAEDCIYIDTDTMEAYIGVNIGSNSASASLFGNVFWRKIGESISNYNGLVNIRTANKNVMSSDGTEIEIGNSDTAVNIVGSVVKINGEELTGSSDIKEDIYITSSNVSNSKFVVIGSNVGDFVVIDNNGYRVIPDEKQIPSGVEIDFTDFDIVGTWTISFIKYKVQERQNIHITREDIINNEYVIRNCYLGIFAIIDENGERILPDERQSGDNVIIDFTGFQDEYFTIQFIGEVDNKSNIITLAKCTGMGEIIENNAFTMTWIDPDDVELNGAKLAEWNKTILVRKVGSYPNNYMDGTILATTSRALGNKNAYRSSGYTDSNRESGVTYYYKLFSQTVSGTWNNVDGNEFAGSTDLSWGMVQHFVRAGRGPALFPVGTVFEVEHPEYTANGHGIYFRVVGHDQVPAADETLTHTMCLDMVDILFNATYDTLESVYALTEDTAAQVNKTYYSLSGSTYTALVEGTDYEVGDTVPAASWYEKNPNERGGANNNPIQSNLLQWANSSGSSNQWFVKQSLWDSCNQVLASKNGFCKHLDSEFLSVVKEARLISSVRYNGTKSAVEHSSKFWPVSLTQALGLANDNIHENTWLSFYADGGSLIKKNYSSGAASDWWLKSAYTNAEHPAYYIPLSGTYNNTFTYVSDSKGYSLACIIA